MIVYVLAKLLSCVHCQFELEIFMYIENFGTRMKAEAEEFSKNAKRTYISTILTMFTFPVCFAYVFAYVAVLSRKNIRRTRVFVPVIVYPYVRFK